MTKKAQGTLVVRDPAVVRAMRTPLRQELLAALERLGTASVKEIAVETGRAPASLYYHVYELARAGLIREAGRRPAGRRPESVYELTAARIVIDRRERSAAFIEAVADLKRATLRTAERELLAALKRPSGGAGPGAPALLLRLTARLTPGDARKADIMLRQLAAFLEKTGNPKGRDTYAFTGAFVRRAAS